LIVADASVVTDLLLGRAVTLAAFEHETRERRQEPAYAPEVVDPEVLNALRRLVRAKRVSTRRATEAVADLSQLRLVRYAHAPLRSRVWELRDRLTAYDACYLTLAEVLGEGAVLMTGDRGFATTARRLLGAERVRLVA
jgi:predicted nucleic acid-binding protein